MPRKARIKTINVVEGKQRFRLRDKKGSYLCIIEVTLVHGRIFIRPISLDSSDELGVSIQ